MWALNISPITPYTQEVNMPFLFAILRGVVPPPLHWALDVVDEVIQEWPELSKGPWDASKEEAVVNLVSDVFDAIPEVNKEDASKLAAALVVAVRLIATAAPRRRKVFPRKRRSVRR
jgi:hypothetical protein